jgi:hypothetical protein
MLKQKILSIMTVLAVAALLFAPVQSARAALIPLDLDAAPTIVAGPLDIRYGSGTLDVDGPAAFFFDGTLHTITDGHEFLPGFPNSRQIIISAEIDSSGNWSSGSLLVVGNVPTAGMNGREILDNEGNPSGLFDDNLLVGHLTDFGFPAAPGDPLEFLFIVDDGDAASFFPLGSEIGLILTSTEFPGSFAQDWHNLDLQTDIWGNESPVNNTGQAIAEIGVPTVIPEPGSLLLIASGLLGLVGLRRTR